MAGSRRILVLEHNDSSGPDAATAHLAARGCIVETLRTDRGDGLPGPEALARYHGALVMGGPQMVTEIDEAPYLRGEMELALRLLDRGTPVLAICLGAQVLAHALGAKVDWHPEGKVALGFRGVTPTPAAGGLFPEGFRALSGNAQGFEIPPGATALATGEIWPNQAYRIGPALALQFHPEVTPPILEDWKRELDGYVGRPGADDLDTLDADFARHDPALKAWLRGLLDRHFGLAPAEAERAL